MSVLFLVLPITLLISIAAVAAFVWATRSGQLDDLETPALRALHDHENVTLSKRRMPFDGQSGRALKR